MSVIVNKIYDDIQKIVTNEKFELYDIEFVKEGSVHFLRILIDTTNGEKISIEDCICINNLINTYLDKNDPTELNYNLEVTSPGIIRKLKKKSHYQREIGNEIEVKCYKVIEGFETKVITAVLTDVSDVSITLNGYEVLFEHIANAKTVFNFGGVK